MGELSRPRPAQLQREAWVYVRQSTMTQVRENTESLNRQYELVDRARELGWGPEQVHVVDEDLGRSGAEASEPVRLSCRSHAGCGSGLRAA
jgi:hypothetical protein